MLRRLLNDAYDVVEEMLDGFCRAHSNYVHLCGDDGRVVVATLLQ